MIGRRRRPLLRTAMIGGAGYMAGKRSQRSAEQESEQEQRLAALEQQPQAAATAPQAAPPAPAAQPQDLVSKLTELKGLLDAGALTPQEFEAAKRQLLHGA